MATFTQDISKDATCCTSCEGTTFSSCYRSSDIPINGSIILSGESISLNVNSGTTMISTLAQDYIISPNSYFTSSMGTFDIVSSLAREAKHSKVIMHIQTAHSIEEQEVVREAFEIRCKHLIFMLKELKLIKAEIEDELKHNSELVDTLTFRLELLEVKDNILKEELKIAKQIVSDLKYNIFILEDKIFFIQGTISNTERNIMELNGNIAAEEVQLVDLIALREELKIRITDKLAEDEKERSLLKESNDLLEKYTHSKMEKIKAIANKLHIINCDKKEFSERSVVVEKKSLDQISSYSKSISTQQITIHTLQSSKKQLLECISEKEKLAAQLSVKIEKVRNKAPSLCKLDERAKELENYTVQQKDLLFELEILRSRDYCFDEKIVKVKKEVNILNDKLANLLFGACEKKEQNKKIISEYQKLIYELEKENIKLTLTLSELSKLEYCQRRGIDAVNALEKELDA